MGYGIACQYQCINKTFIFYFWRKIYLNYINSKKPNFASQASTQLFVYSEIHSRYNTAFNIED